ncbi:MAG: hypothetical protein QOE06_1422 [Thermoleophilaceae bacterium]|jgi:hypothetical protein|nr:hypothetical protein [Thermoleophilaceae bacterium]
MAMTESERWFESYLRSTGHDGWQDHEPELGIPTRPDYLVSKSGAAAICEVKEFVTSGVHSRAAALSARRAEAEAEGRPGPSRSFNTSDKEEFGDIRAQVREAARQLKPLAAAGVPLVAVLANPLALLMNLSPAHVGYALNGNPTFGGPYDSERGEVLSLGPVKGRSGKLTNDHQYLSAVLILCQRSGARDRARAWFDAHGPRIRAEHETRAAQAEALLAASPSDWGPEDEYYSVDVLHTVSALEGRAVRLPAELFDGEHDRVYEPDGAGFYELAR